MLVITISLFFLFNLNIMQTTTIIFVIELCDIDDSVLPITQISTTIKKN
jgi:hypothetical protein